MEHEYRDSWHDYGWHLYHSQSGQIKDSWSNSSREMQQDCGHHDIFLHTLFDFFTCTLVHTQITHARLQIQTHLLEKKYSAFCTSIRISQKYISLGQFGNTWMLIFVVPWHRMDSKSLPRSDENTNHWCINALNLSLKTKFSFVSNRNNSISACLFVNSKHWFR